MKAFVLRTFACAGLGLFLSLGCGGGEKKKPTHATETVAPTEIAHEAADECADGKDNDEDGFEDCDDLDCRADSDACKFAPSLDSTVPTNIVDSWSFLAKGKDPVQKDVEADAFMPKRRAVIHGTVVGADDKPLRDVAVTVQGHPEFGFTMTRSDGRFDLLVNGGSILVFQYEKVGFLGAQRAVATRWLGHAMAPEVGLVELSSTAHRVQLGKAQAVAGDKIEDDYGTRQPLLIFAEGTEAEAVLRTGEHPPLDELDLRITEYPYEPLPEPRQPGDSPRFAPGTLPVSNALSYTLDVTVDQAEELEALRVEFTKPVTVYVDDFLDMPTGVIVPLYAYDEETGTWDTPKPGRVVEVVGVSKGKAELDLDGDGKANDEDPARELEIKDQELRELGSRYTVGQRLWRTQVTHFSAFTEAWTSVAPGVTPPDELPTRLKLRAEPNTARGNVLLEDLAVHEAVGIVGTPVALVYQSDRAPGYSDGCDVSIPLLGDKVPSKLKSVTVVVDIAGRRESKTLTPAKNLSHTYHWDAKDAAARTMQGEQKADIWVGYGFTGVLGTSVSEEAQAGPTEEVTGAVPSVVLWRKHNVLLGIYDARGLGLGRFTLNVQHVYNPESGVLYFGDGRKRSSDDTRLLAVAVDLPDKDAGQARHILSADSMAVAADGSVYVSDDPDEGKGPPRVWHITADGEYEVLLGRGASGAAGSIDLGSPQGIAIDPSSGNIYVTDWTKPRIYRLSPSGAVDVLIGESGALVTHELTDPDGLAVGRTGELYIADADKVWKYNGGAVTLYAGGGTEEVATSATELKFGQASGLAVDQVVVARDSS